MRKLTSAPYSLPIRTKKLQFWLDQFSGEAPERSEVHYFMRALVGSLVGPLYGPRGRELAGVLEMVS